MATIAMSAAAIGFRETTLNVGGESVPLSVWYPTKGAAGSSGPGKYTYPLSIGTIAARLGKLPTPTWLALPICVRGDARAVVPGAPLPAPEEAPPAVFFAHGFLGSRFDMLHVAEALAARGLVVASADLPESLSASFAPNDGTTRASIVEAAFAALERDFGASGTQRGIFGHSAGGGTASAVPGRFPLGRVAIAGFRGYEGQDPLLVIASAGDRVIPLGLVRDNLPAGTREYRGSAGAEQLVKSLSVQDAAQGAAQPRSALFFEAGLGGLPGDGAAARARAPCHISFLSAQTNDALVAYLSPLLPLARALDVPLLDFDVYADSRDSAATASAFVPAVAEFFLANARAAAGARGA